MKKLIFLFLILSVVSCQPDNAPSDPVVPIENFDRQAMLAGWADNIIIPGYQSFVSTTNELKNKGLAFSDNPSDENFTALKTAWLDAYMMWQKVSMFEIGKAEELRLRNNLNIYPVNVEELHKNVLEGGYNLELNSEIDRQGFPALDYLLFGIRDGDAATMSFYKTAEEAPQYLTYLAELVTRIDDLANVVLSDWTSGYKEQFVSNSGNSATSSVDKLVNDYIYYFEKNLRAGKIGIPAGVFSANPLSEKVEGFYKKDISKELFMTALTATEDFFKGKHFNGSAKSESLNSYLNYLNTAKNGTDLSTLIQEQFNNIHIQAEKLGQDFAHQVETDNIQMLATYDQLQLNVVLLKVDMLQAMNINVDYVDADGD